MYKFSFNGRCVVFITCSAQREPLHGRCVEYIYHAGELMKRWHEDYTITYREWKKHHNSHIESNIDHSGWWERIGKDPYEIDCPCDTQIGRFRKKDAFDCGNAKCYLCHSDKLPKRERTYQELCADLKLKEGITEYFENLY